MSGVAPTLVSPIKALLLGLSLALAVSCDTPPATGDTITTGTYEATATVTYTRQMEYARSFDQARTIRQETFGSTSLVNRNGLPPEGAATGPDADGLWWPPLPPEPTAAELEARKQHPNERMRPDLLKQVDYAITFDHQGQRRTLATTPQVYQEAARALDQEQALELIYGPGETTIARARALASFQR